MPTVPRRDLLDRLSSSREPLILVSAPAGYGKTTAPAAVDRATTRRPAAWVQLEPLHDDPVALLCLPRRRARGTSLRSIPRARELLGLRDAPLEERVLPALSAAVEAAPPFLLVLDDAHHVDRRHVLALPRRCSWTRCRREARLAIASRTDPPLPLARLRAAGRLTEVRLQDLRMTAPRPPTLLRLHDRDADDDELDGLLSSTEGWATGLYLAILAGRSGAVAEPHGDLRQIADYLTAEVLDRQPPDLQEFLLLTSVLDKLSAGLCRAVTLRYDAHVLLERLARENLFVTPLDDRDEWFRYHHLFAELLRSQLERRAPAEIDTLNRRAASWYEADDDLERAVRHYVAAGSGYSGYVQDLAALACDRLAMVGQYERARQVLALFTEDQAMRSPALCLTAALLGSCLSDPGVQRLSRHGMSLTSRRRPVAGGRRLAAVLAGMPERPACSGRGDADAPRRELACELESPAGPDGWRDSAEAMRVMALYLLGRVGQAKPALAEATASGDLGELLPWWLGMRALIAADQEDWRLAEELDGQTQAIPPPT